MKNAVGNMIFETFTRHKPMREVIPEIEASPVHVDHRKVSPQILRELIAYSRIS
jgi:hypothetical protein